MNDELSICARQGFDAHGLGFAFHESAYEPDSPEAMLWRAGWDDAALGKPAPEVGAWEALVLQMKIETDKEEFYKAEALF